MRNGYRKQFYKILFKKSIQEIPKIMAVILVVAIISAALIFSITSIFGENVTKINVAYVFEEEDEWFSVGLKYMAKGANCNLKKYKKDAALRALEKNEIAAVLLVYNASDAEDFNPALPVNAVEFIYSDNDQFLTSMFGSIVSAGITDYLVLNATRDVVKATYDDYNRSKFNDFEDELMDYLIHRNRYYERIVFYDSGDIPLKHYYLGNAVALIILLSSSVVIGFGKNDDKNFIKFAKRTGLTKFDLFASKYLAFIGFFSVLTGVGIAAFQYIIWDEFMISGILSSMLATIVLLSLIILIHEIFPDKTVSTLFCIFVSVIFLFLSGNIIPLTFLPDQVAQISEYILTKYPSALYGQTFFGRMNGGTITSALICLAITVVLTLVVSFTRGDAYENN